jgi:hypothetical protein
LMLPPWNPRKRRSSALRGTCDLLRGPARFVWHPWALLQVGCPHALIISLRNQGESRRSPYNFNNGRNS